MRLSPAQPRQGGGAGAGHPGQPAGHAAARQDRGRDRLSLDRHRKDRRPRGEGSLGLADATGAATTCWQGMLANSDQLQRGSMRERGVRRRASCCCHSPRDRDGDELSSAVHRCRYPGEAACRLSPSFIVWQARQVVERGLPVVLSKRTAVKLPTQGENNGHPPEFGSEGPGERPSAGGQQCDRACRGSTARFPRTASSAGMIGESMKRRSMRRPAADLPAAGPAPTIGASRREFRQPGTPRRGSCEAAVR